MRLRSFLPVHTHLKDLQYPCKPSGTLCVGKGGGRAPAFAFHVPSNEEFNALGENKKQEACRQPSPLQNKVHDAAQHLCKRGQPGQDPRMQESTGQPRCRRHAAVDQYTYPL